MRDLFACTALAFLLAVFVAGIVHRGDESTRAANGQDGDGNQIEVKSTQSTNGANHDQ